MVATLGVRRKRPGTRTASQPFNHGIALALAGDLPDAFGHSLIQDGKLFAHALRHEPDALRIRSVALQFDRRAPDFGGADLDDDAKVREQPPDAVEQRCSLRFPSFAQAVPGQALSLLFRLDRNKTHPRCVQRRENGFRIAGVILDALILTVGADELGGDQPRLQVQSLHRAPPAMGSAACFHRYYFACR